MQTKCVILGVSKVYDVTCRTSSLETHGKMYRQGDLVIHSIANEQPVFATITHFISTEIEHFFVLRFVRTLGYCYHYHAYKIDTSITGSKCCVCTQTDLIL